MDPSKRWLAVKFDERHAAKTGMPAVVPVPEDQIEKVKSGGLGREQAIEWIVEFIQENPNHEMVEDLQRYIRRAKLWDQAVGRLQSRNWEEARDLLEDIISIEEGDAAAHFNLGAAYRNLKEYESALEAYRACEDIFGDDGVYYTNRGRTFQAIGRIDDAIADFEEALRRMPEDTFALERLVELGARVPVYKDPTDPKKVSLLPRAEFQDAVRKSWGEEDRDAGFFLAAARAHEREGQSQLAFEAGERAETLDPKNPDAPLIKCRALIQLDKIDEAEQAILHHLSLTPESSIGHTLLGRIQVSRGQNKAARQSLDRAVELDRNQAEAIECLVRLESPTGDLDAAEAALKPLLRRKSWAPWFVLASALLEKGDDDKAFAAFDKAIDRGAGDEVLARYLSELGRAGQLERVVRIADQVDDLAEHAEAVRWNVAIALKSVGRRSEGKRLLEALADDLSAHPNWRRRASMEVERGGKK